MEDNAAPHPSAITKFARPALIAGAVITVVCIGLLIIIFALDSFNAATYSVAGKSVNDATDEARDIRELYSGARTGGIITLVIAGVVTVASAVLLYLNRGNAPLDEDDDGEDYDLDDLTGR
ncbi:hypothetical protein SAMN04487917_101544 [Arthrobacter sp. yr096]|uniref:hypothetical protein n=1 Tax=unclassified Arthrobacter TaxID=235627 RepID=UPI00089584E4|nr:MULTISPECIES: hypothetical protein [unclassified Arthrobacter]SDW26682.1 hypothetical protein SAMN04487912_102103 [Arthrobacter sp. cf158]SEI48499.1 hypothetical protein SAMN04487917_101544 [Arthrobacter sp. yr096]